MQSAYPIASLTKMMVALLTMEDIRAGLFTWEDKVQWTREQYVGRGKKAEKKLRQQPTIPFAMYLKQQ